MPDMLNYRPAPKLAAVRQPTVKMASSSSPTADVRCKAPTTTPAPPTVTLPSYMNYTWLARARAWCNPGGPIFRVLQLISVVIDELIIVMATAIAKVGLLWPSHNIEFRLRSKVKSVWAPLPASIRRERYDIPNSRNGTGSAQLTLGMPRDLPAYAGPEEVVRRQIKWHKDCLPSHIVQDSIKPHTRKMRLNARSSAYLRDRSLRWRRDYRAELGINSATRFTTQTEATSIGRYNLDPVCTQEGENLLTLARMHFIERYRTYFANTDIWTDRQFARNMVHKYGPGPLLEGLTVTTDWFLERGAPAHLTRLMRTGTRTRAHCRTTGVLAAVELQVKRDLESGTTDLGLHGTFKT